MRSFGHSHPSIHPIPGPFTSYPWLANRVCLLSEVGIGSVWGVCEGWKASEEHHSREVKLPNPFPRSVLVFARGPDFPSFPSLSSACYAGYGTPKNSQHCNNRKPKRWISLSCMLKEYNIVKTTSRKEVDNCSWLTRYLAKLNVCDLVIYSVVWNLNQFISPLNVW